jgi:hypothetical protein
MLSEFGFCHLITKIEQFPASGDIRLKYPQVNNSWGVFSTNYCGIPRFSIVVQLYIEIDPCRDKTYLTDLLNVAIFIWMHGTGIAF